MVLGFTQKIDKKPNGFCEKIHVSLLENKLMTSDDHYEYSREFAKKFKTHWHGYDSFLKPKPHTIREDAHDRWKSGNDIHFVINNRTPERFQFAPVVKCISTQLIKIKHTAAGLFVIVDNKILNHNETETLAINDGFESLDDFFKYFNKSFSGKIIHWTDKKY